MVYAMACADDVYMPSAKFQLETALKKGKVDEILCYNLADIDEEFKNKNKDILDFGTGRRHGCYLWKPYFVNKALLSIEYGDFLIYMDAAGGYYRSGVHNIVSYMVKNNINMIGSRRYKYLEKHWTKRDAFVYMDCDEKKYINQCQCWAGFFILRKTEETINIMSEWLKYAQDYRIITDADNVCGMDNYEGFVENRHDQSILSILMKKYDVKIIEEIPKADFYVYHHTMETSIKSVKRELSRRRQNQIKNYLEHKNYKGVYYIERERFLNIRFIQYLNRKYC
jgi:hypothetical protein